MHSPKNSIEMARVALYGSGKSVSRPRVLPICIHGHTSKLPLLANFPKERVDVNPYHLPEVLTSEFNWDNRTIDVQICAKKLESTCTSRHVAFFLDSFTIENVLPTNFDLDDAEIILFIGDTQHGSFEGFLKLIRFASNPAISKVISVNNPQHLNLFRAYGVPTTKLFYCPLGVANLPPWLSSNEQPFLVEHSNKLTSYLCDSPVFVGSLTPFHPRRREYINSLAREGLCRVIKTSDYSDACYIHNSAQISLNISLNSDINFRFGEVITSGGGLLSDRLPWTQQHYISQFFGKNIYWFNGLPELRDILTSLKKTPKHEIARVIDDDSPFADLYRRGVHLISIESLNHYLIPFSDERAEIEHNVRKRFPTSIACNTFEERLIRYVENRDAVLQMNSTSDPSTFIITEDTCPLSLLDASDLQFSFVKDISETPAIRYTLDQLNKGRSLFKEI